MFSIRNQSSKGKRDITAAEQTRAEGASADDLSNPLCALCCIRKNRKISVDKSVKNNGLTTSPEFFTVFG